VATNGNSQPISIKDFISLIKCSGMFFGMGM
jgi:hypothetical protein